MSCYNFHCTEKTYQQQDKWQQPGLKLVSKLILQTLELGPSIGVMTNRHFAIMGSIFPLVWKLIFNKQDFKILKLLMILLLSFSKKPNQLSHNLYAV